MKNKLMKNIAMGVMAILVNCQLQMSEGKLKTEGIELNSIETNLVKELNKYDSFEIVNISNEKAIVYRDLRVTIYPTKTSDFVDFSISNGYYNSNKKKSLKIVDNVINLDDVFYVEAKDILEKGLNHHNLKYNDKQLESYISYDYDTTAVRIKTKSN